MSSWIYLRKREQGSPAGWLYTVGFFAPDGSFHGDSDHNSSEHAAARVHWLNGGSEPLEEQVRRLVRQHEDARQVDRDLDIEVPR